MIIRQSLKGCGLFMMLSIGTLGCSLSSGNARDGAKPNKSSQLILSSQEPHEKEQSKPNQDEQTHSLKLIKTAGWLIPGLSQSKVEESRRPFDNGDGQKIFYTVLIPQREVVTEFKPETSEQKRLRLFKQKWLIDSIRQYDINRYVFCYKVFASIVDTDYAGKIVTRYGASTAIVYYDEDGDGDFETIDLGDNLAPPRIPHWVQ